MSTKKYSKEQIEKVKEFYLNNDFSFDDISKNSQDLFGFSVSLPDIKYYSRKERWGVLKANSGRETKDVSINEKLSIIADKLYDVMVDEEDPIPATALSQIARTWSDLLIKSKLDKETSVKTDTQAVKDWIAEFESGKKVTKKKRGRPKKE